MGGGKHSLNRAATEPRNAHLIVENDLNALDIHAVCWTQHPSDRSD